jgi:hypothetical protein
MTSTHRLIAIIVIWIVTLLIAWLLFNASFLNSMDDTAAALLLGVLTISAGAGTWAIARRN